MRVVEVNRTRPAERRKQGKTDRLDAYRAAQVGAVRGGHHPAKDGQIEGLRALHITCRSAVKARTAALRQIHQMLITAPDAIRERYRAMSDRKLIDTLARCRPPRHDLVLGAIMSALKDLAGRYRFLDRQAATLNETIRALARSHNPGLLGAHGVGPDTAAQLLITAGANPDRLTKRGLLRRPVRRRPGPGVLGQDHPPPPFSWRGPCREQRPAPHCPGPHDQPRPDQGLRRPATRQGPLQQGDPAPAQTRHRPRDVQVPHPRDHHARTDDLRPLRQAKNITLTQAANHFGVWPMHISTLERGTRRDDTLATAYRQWLTTA